MSALSRPGSGPLTFCYARPEGFSGQKAATQLVLNGLAARGWICRELSQPVLDREGGWRALLHYSGKVLGVWLHATGLLWQRSGGLCVGLGQTRASFLRDSVPLLLGRIGLGRERVIVSLHGSLFMQWPETSLDARLFRCLLRNAGLVTVLGERQRCRLVALGVPEARAVVVVNSCELAPVSRAELETRLDTAVGSEAPLRYLYLSSLIDTKGYPEYLEALHRLAALPGRRIEAVLCGCLVESGVSARFSDLARAGQWIEEKMIAINRSDRVRVRWVKGTAGAAKAALFRTADVFVLPTYYAVEAQPLVLLEAMTSGCAIITTRIAEIPTILDSDSALFVEAPAVDGLVQALQTLAEDDGHRTRLARAAHRRYVECYRIERHLDAWEKLLRPVSAPT